MAGFFTDLLNNLSIITRLFIEDSNAQNLDVTKNCVIGGVIRSLVNGKCTTLGNQGDCKGSDQFKCGGIFHDQCVSRTPISNLSERCFKKAESVTLTSGGLSYGFVKYHAKKEYDNLCNKPIKKNHGCQFLDKELNGVKLTYSKKAEKNQGSAKTETASSTTVSNGYSNIASANKPSVAVKVESVSNSATLQVAEAGVVENQVTTPITAGQAVVNTSQVSSTPGATASAKSGNESDTVAKVNKISCDKISQNNPCVEGSLSAREPITPAGKRMRTDDAYLLNVCKKGSWMRDLQAQDLTTTIDKYPSDSSVKSFLKDLADSIPIPVTDLLGELRKPGPINVGVRNEEEKIQNMKKFADFYNEKNNLCTPPQINLSTTDGVNMNCIDLTKNNIPCVEGAMSIKENKHSNDDKNYYLLAICKKDKNNKTNYEEMINYPAIGAFLKENQNNSIVGDLITQDLIGNFKSTDAVINYMLDPNQKVLNERIGTEDINNGYKRLKTFAEFYNKKNNLCSKINDQLETNMRSQNAETNCTYKSKNSINITDFNEIEQVVGKNNNLINNFQDCNSLRDNKVTKLKAFIIEKHCHKNPQVKCLSREFEKIIPIAISGGDPVRSIQYIDARGEVKTMDFKNFKNEKSNNGIFVYSNDTKEYYKVDQIQESHPCRVINYENIPTEYTAKPECLSINKYLQSRPNLGGNSNNSSGGVK